MMGMGKDQRLSKEEVSVTVGQPGPPLALAVYSPIPEQDPYNPVCSVLSLSPLLCVHPFSFLIHIPYHVLMLSSLSSRSFIPHCFSLEWGYVPSMHRSLPIGSGSLSNSREAL